MRIIIIYNYLKTEILILRALDYVITVMETANKPKIIGFYCDFNNIHWVKTFAREVKKRYPEVILLAGGPQTAGLDADFLKATVMWLMGLRDLAEAKIASCEVGTVRDFFPCDSCFSNSMICPPNTSISG